MNYRAFLAIGSNLGDSRQQLLNCLVSLSEICEIVATSQKVRSEPVDMLEQPLFFNQVLQVIYPVYEDDHLGQKQQTLHSAFKFHHLLKNIERSHSLPKKIHKGPRFLDIDLIWFEGLKLSTNQLILPHPHWSKRWFVRDLLSELSFWKELSQNKRESLCGPDDLIVH